MIILAIFTGILGFFNYFWQTSNSLSTLLNTVSLAGQVILVLLTLIAVFGYKGRRSRADYETGAYKIWTMRFGIIILSLLANIGILVVIMLNTFGIISEF